MLLEIEKVSGSTPRGLAERPRLEPHLAVYQAIYDRLSRARQWSDGSPQAVTVSEVFAYCDGLRIYDIEFRENLLDIVQAMDGEFISICAEQAKASMDKAGKSDVVG